MEATISKETVTLVAAAIAAFAALISLGGNLLGARRAEMRASHRTALLNHIESIGEGVHETAASAVILRKRYLRGADAKPWRDFGSAGSDKLKAVRPKVKYTLYGLDEPLRTLSRMPEWIATYKDIPDTNADQLLAEMKSLAEAVDDAVRRSYRRGLPPGSWTRWQLRGQTKKVRTLWGQRFDEAAPR